MAKKKKRRDRERKPSQPPPGRLLDGLEEANQLIRGKRWLEARTVLEKLDRRYPHRLEIVSELAFVYYQLNDFGHHQSATEQAVALDPRNADLALMLAGAYLVNLRPVLAVRAFRRFAERWPDHPRA